MNFSSREKFMQFEKAWANSGLMWTSMCYFSSSLSLRAFTASLILDSNFAFSTVNRTSAIHFLSICSQSRSSGIWLRALWEPLASSSMSSTVRPSIYGKIINELNKWSSREEMRSSSQASIPSSASLRNTLPLCAFPSWIFNRFVFEDLDPPQNPPFNMALTTKLAPETSQASTQ